MQLQINHWAASQIRYKQEYSCVPIVSQYHTETIELHRSDHMCIYRSIPFSDVFLTLIIRIIRVGNYFFRSHGNRTAISIKVIVFSCIMHNSDPTQNIHCNSDKLHSNQSNNSNLCTFNLVIQSQFHNIFTMAIAV